MKFINLHSSDPSVEGSQAGGYESYAAVPMDSVRWEDGRNVDHISFPEATGGVVTLSYVAVTDDDGRVLRAGPLIRPLYVETGITPRFVAGEMDFNEDDEMNSTEPPAVAGRVKRGVRPRVPTRAEVDARAAERERWTDEANHMAKEWETCRPFDASVSMALRELVRRVCVPHNVAEQE